MSETENVIEAPVPAPSERARQMAERTSELLAEALEPLADHPDYQGTGYGPNVLLKTFILGLVFGAALVAVAARLL